MTCDTGYTGSGTATCQPDGTFTSVTCAAAACTLSGDSTKDGTDGAFYCLNGGTVGGTTSSCTCTCAANYEGTTCQTSAECCRACSRTPLHAPHEAE